MELWVIYVLSCLELINIYLIIIRVIVAKPMAIEWPYSLVDVVVAWNIPMHQWLKRC